jgi:hypothetical protein
MDWKQKDWVEHSTFGVGQVSDERGDRLEIDFVGAARKTLLKSTELKPSAPPSPAFKLLRDKKKSYTPQFKVGRPLCRPPLDFDHLVECFVRFFDGGFDSEDFEKRERTRKGESALLLKSELGRDRFDRLLRDRDYRSRRD